MDKNTEEGKGEKRDKMNIRKKMVIVLSPCWSENHHSDDVRLCYTYVLI
jgi:hypothetical protein